MAQACGAYDLVDGRDWRDLSAGEIDVAFVCSPPLIWLNGAVEAIAAPVLRDARFRGRPLYCSDVVVARAASYRSLKDLRGARWAYNEPSSWSGYWVTLSQVGDWSYFGEVVPSGYHQRALRMVAAGEVDAAAIDCQVLAVELRDHPELSEQLRIIDSLGPAPVQPVVVRADLDPKLKRSLQRRLFGLDGAIMERFFVESFVPPPDYSSVAAVVGSRAPVTVAR